MGNWVVYSDTLAHHGILGMKWGIRRYQNVDGSLTKEGRERYAPKSELRKLARIDKYNDIASDSNRSEKKRAAAMRKSAVAMMNLKGKDCFVDKDGNFNKDVEHMFKNADGTPTKFGKTLMRETDYDNYRTYERLSEEAEISRNLMNSAFGGTETERDKKRNDTEFGKSYERSIALLNDYYKNERFINAVEKDHDTFKALLTEASSTHDPNDLATLIWSGQMNNEMNTIKYRYADSPYRKNGKSK